LKYRSNLYIVVFAILGIVATAAPNAQAQINTDIGRNGSIYSYLGIGVPTDFTSADADPMGLTGVSFYDPYVPNMSNPAQWGSAVYTQASGGLILQQFKATDPFSSATNVNVTATHFQAVFPLMKNKLGLSVSLTPITRTNFRALSDVTLGPGQNNSGGDLRYVVENRGDGGFDQFEIGLGWRINKMFSVGYAGSVVFGEVTNDLNTLFEDNDYSPITIHQSLTGRAFRHRLGLFVNRNKMFSDEDELSGGVSVTLPTSISGDFQATTDIPVQVNGSSVLKTFDLPGTDLSGDIDLPLGIDGGLAYRFSRNVTVASEVRYQEWSSYQNFAKNDESNLVDRMKIGAGIKYLPYLESSSTFFSRFKYFAGVSYDTGHLSINGERIQTVMGSVGLGIPAPRSRSSIHISLQYGQRGTQTANLVKEDIWSVKVSFNLAEMMFIQSKFQ
jgi:hypothetical protein